MNCGHSLSACRDLTLLLLLFYAEEYGDSDAEEHKKYHYDDSNDDANSEPFGCFVCCATIDDIGVDGICCNCG